MQALQVPDMNSFVLGAVLFAFLLAMLAIGLWSRGRIESAEDYLVAGRRLPLSLAWATLFATWFGAGTLLTATDEVRAEGLRAAALEPIGAGLCLILAGLFFARKLWSMRLLTLADFYARRFGPRAELVASLIMIPSYFGWIAAQFVALAGVLELYWAIPAAHGIWLVALVGTGYTVLGGMWSVTLTDIVQLAILLAGLGVLAVGALLELGTDAGMAAGWLRLLEATPPEKLVLIPSESAAALLAWISVLGIGMLGNLPGQDLAQRIFASRSAQVAVAACLLAGVLYIVLGMIPVLAGLAADLIVGPEGSRTATLPLLVGTLLSPAMSIVFVLALVAAVMSTIDSAVLAPSSVLANNLLRRVWPDASLLGLSRAAVVAVAATSLAVAYVGASAYELLESAYAITMVGLFVPLTVGLHSERGSERAALFAMLTGIGIWGLHALLGWETLGGFGGWALPSELAATVLAWLAYEVVALKGPSRHLQPSAGAVGLDP
jgi:SSS family solute:Na+ symporter